MVPFTYYLGDDLGYKLWAVVASLPPIAAVYLFSTMFLPRSGALLAAIMIAIDPFQGEMFVTGSLPLLGFSLILVLLWALMKVADHGQSNLYDWKIGGSLIVSIALIPYINQTAAGIAAILIPVALGVLMFGRRYYPIHFKGIEKPLHYVREKRWPLMFWRPTVVYLAIGTVLACGALPWYFLLKPVNGLLRYEGPLIYLSTDIAMFQFILAVPLGLYVFFKAENFSRQIAGAMLIVTGTLLLFLSHDETIINIFYRSRYLVMMFLYPALVWTIRSLHLAWPTRYTVAAAAVGILFAGHLYALDAQSDYSLFMSPDVEMALEVIENDPEGHSGIISNAYSMSLWVSALSKVHSPNIWVQKPPKAYQDEDKLVRCVLGWVDGCEPLSASKSLATSHVLIDERHPCQHAHRKNYLAPVDQWNVTAGSEWLELVYSQGSVRLYRIHKLDT